MRAVALPLRVDRGGVRSLATKPGATEASP